MKAIVMLEDGFTLYGSTFAGDGETMGEVVFNTGMTGYQEMITDPSYKNQILTFTYPLIGNYGCNDSVYESAIPRAAAVLVKEYCRRPYSLYSNETLAEFLQRYDTMGIEGIDTRTLTLHLRRFGTMKGVISTTTFNPDELMDRLNNYPGISGVDLVKEVTTKKVYEWQDPVINKEDNIAVKNTKIKHVAVLDMGVKYSILRSLSRRGCRITVFPANTGADEIKDLNPDGVLFSNGPGDPATLDYLMPTVKELLGWRPVMGICLGHQVIGRALGAKTFKLNFGHRGGNHPVKELSSGRVYITAQNHGFCISDDSVLPAGTKITHMNLNDNTVEGLENERDRFFSVQFHPEAGPGPHDCRNLFDRFLAML